MCAIGAVLTDTSSEQLKRCSNDQKRPDGEVCEDWFVMLKKGVPIPFTDPNSIMARVYQSIKDGNTSVFHIALNTKIKQKSVSCAVWNLRTTGQIRIVIVERRKSRYYITEE